MKIGLTKNADKLGEFIHGRTESWRPSMRGQSCFGKGFEIQSRNGSSDSSSKDFLDKEEREMRRTKWWTGTDFGFGFFS
ncbi:hypothetical protein U1Q18_010050 [Sarracenia purpurea var. burkii]